MKAYNSPSTKKIVGTRNNNDNFVLGSAEAEVASDNISSMPIRPIIPQHNPEKRKNLRIMCLPLECFFTKLNNKYEINPGGNIITPPKMLNDFCLYLIL